MFNLDLTWINRFFNEKCVFSFTRQFDGSRKPSVNIAINQQIYKYFKKYFIILKNTGRYVLESTKQRDVRWHVPSCMRWCPYDKQTENWETTTFPRSICRDKQLPHAKGSSIGISKGNCV